MKLHLSKFFIFQCLIFIPTLKKLAKKCWIYCSFQNVNRQPSAISLRLTSLIHFSRWLSAGGGRQPIVLARHVSRRLQRPQLSLAVVAHRYFVLICYGEIKHHFVLRAKFQQSNTDSLAHMSNLPKTIQSELACHRPGFQEILPKNYEKKKY